MKLEEMKCKGCGAKLNVEDGADSVTCPYCNVTYRVQDVENSGYEFEKGRIKAQKEHLRSLTAPNYAVMIPIIIGIIAAMIIGITMTMRHGNSSDSINDNVSRKFFR